MELKNIWFLSLFSNLIKIKLLICCLIPPVYQILKHWKLKKLQTQNLLLNLWPVLLYSVAAFLNTFSEYPCFVYWKLCFSFSGAFNIIWLRTFYGKPWWEAIAGDKVKFKTLAMLVFPFRALGKDNQDFQNPALKVNHMTIQLTFK